MGSVIRYVYLFVTNQNQSRPALHSSNKIFEPTMDEAQVHQIIEANNGVLLKQMSDLISAQVASLKRPAEDSVSIRREIKKIKTADTRPVFKKKSNEEQYKASTKVLDTLEDTKYNLESNNLEAVKIAVDQATVQSSPIPTIVSRGTTFGQVSRAFGPQRLVAGACFACGKIGHWRANCPLN